MLTQTSNSTDKMGHEIQAQAKKMPVGFYLVPLNKGFASFVPGQKLSSQYLRQVSARMINFIIVII